MNIVIGADYRGYKRKEELKAWLAEQGHVVEDLGCETAEENSFVPYAAAVAQRVAHDSNVLGIVICGSGAGVTIAANKVAGARAVLAQSPEVAEHGRRSDDMNILALSADFTSFASSRAIVRAFLETEFEPLERRVQRLEQIAALERGESAHS
ncbi:MAG: RpiB/LacA/LacB family sugar-phosphate isomerase [bacterium]|nr:RpiB/LacA/LacB family sugar-phosphate isomerase [bacterium]